MGKRYKYNLGIDSLNDHDEKRFNIMWIGWKWKYSEARQIVEQNQSLYFLKILFYIGV